MILKDPNFLGKTAYLGAIHNARFRQVVRSADVLQLEVTMDNQKENMGIVKAKALVEGKKSARLSWCLSLISPRIKFDSIRSFFLVLFW